ncbi:MAG: ABC transporter ATP-binding protein [Clostridiales bacterium]|nr:ABC transporter ATP-binding protein [Clostridiales bacterium]
MNKTVLKCENINKIIKKKQILNNVSLELKEGEILSFIGPNGAGKTTTIKLILGLQSITSGTVTINGFDIQKDFTKAIEKVGAIVENPDFYMYLTGRQNLELAANMYSNIDKKRIDEVINLVGLQNRIDDKVSKYSLGMRQRLGIAQAILNKPNLLVLDEPTNGLDPEGIKELRTFLVKLATEENMAIFISSHNLAELESFCNTVCIIQNGTVIENSTMEKIKSGLSSEKFNYEIEINNTDLLKNIPLFNNNENISIIDTNHFKLNIEKHNIPEILKTLVNNNIEIYEVKQEKISLEDAFLKKTGGNVID